MHQCLSQVYSFNDEDALSSYMASIGEREGEREWLFKSNFSLSQTKYQVAMLRV